MIDGKKSDLRNDFDFLPGVLAEIASVIGLDGALTIAEARGGARLSIPARVREDSPLAQIVGMAQARLLSEYYTSGRGAVELNVPLGPTGARAAMKRAIRRLIDEGCSIDEIACRLRISSRTVSRWKTRDRRDDNGQGSLF